jgi:arginine utilization protein RocB
MRALTLLEIVELARAGANWEFGNAVGVAEPDAQEHAREMQAHMDELDRLLRKFKCAHAAHLTIDDLLELEKGKR